MNQPNPIPSSILNNGPNTDTRPLTEQTHESEPVYFISKHSKAKKDNIIFVNWKREMKKRKKHTMQRDT